MSNPATTAAASNLTPNQLDTLEMLIEDQRLFPEIHAADGCDLPAADTEEDADALELSGLVVVTRTPQGTTLRLAPTPVTLSARGRQLPALMQDHQHTVGPWAGQPPRQVDRKGWGPNGELVWVTGPEPLGPRGGARYCVRTRTVAGQRDNRSKVWDGGCGIHKSKTAAVAAFRQRVGAA